MDFDQNSGNRNRIDDRNYVLDEVTGKIVDNGFNADDW